jgi:ribosomal protein L21E
MPRKFQIKLINFFRGSSRSIIMNNYKHCEAVDFKINKSFKSQDPNDSFIEQ